MSAPAPPHATRAATTVYAPDYTDSYDNMATMAAHNLAGGKNNPLFDSNEALNFGLLDDPLHSANQSNLGSLSSLPNALMETSTTSFLPDATTSASAELDYAITAAFPSLAQSLGQTGSHLDSGSMPPGLDFGFTLPPAADQSVPSPPSFNLNDVERDPAPRRKRSARAREVSYLEQTSPATDGGPAASMGSSPVTMEEDEDDGIVSSPLWIGVWPNPFDRGHP